MYKEPIANLMEQYPVTTKEKVFLIPRGKNIRIIHQKDILYVKADSNYSVFVTDDKTEWTICQTLEYIEKSLENSNEFCRCHRSFLVNLAKVQGIALNKNELTLLGDIKIPMSRRKRKSFVGAILHVGSSTTE